MVEKPELSKGEMTVARLLWDHGPATVRAIHQSLPEDQAMDFATVQTYLRRLETKGYATSILEGKTRIYSSKSKPKAVIRKTVDDFVSRLFGGQTMPLVRHLIEEHGIDGNDLAELRQLLDRLEQQNKGDRT